MNAERGQVIIENLSPVKKQEYLYRTTKSELYGIFLKYKDMDREKSKTYGDSERG